MTSEAEIERLYQLFVTNGGGALSFSGTNLTPKQYADAVSTSNLTPFEMAQLEARQHQYNRQKALGTIADEIGNNTFNNPYSARGAYGNSLLNALAGSSGAIAAGLLNGGFSSFSGVDRALLVAGVLTRTGVDLEKVIKVAGLVTIGGAMYTSLINHTNQQTANLPKTLEDAGSLSTMNEQFGEQGDPCSFFNQLMGILSGIFDGTLNFIETAIGDIMSLINKTGIPAILGDILNALTAAGGVVSTAIASVVGLISGVVKEVLGALMPIVGKIINAIADITNQIANEISALADMAAELLKKAFALLIGAAGLDPCKRAVLENTGSPAMKGALTQLNQPLGTGNPHSIGTTPDPRANPDEVTKKMSQAQAEALLRNGVPQSPFTSAAQEYSTFDSSLHSFSPITESIRPKTMPGDSLTTSTDAHGFNNSPMTSRNGGETMDQFRKRTGASQSANSMELESNAMKSKQVYAKSANKMIRDWRKKQLDYTRDSRALMADMKKALSKDNFNNKTALKSRIKQLLEIQYASGQQIENLTKQYIPSFYYWTNGGIPNKATEEKIELIYNTSIRPTQERIYNNAVNTLASNKTEWNSIDTQIY